MFSISLSRDFSRNTISQLFTVYFLHYACVIFTLDSLELFNRKTRGERVGLIQEKIVHSSSIKITESDFKFSSDYYIRFDDLVRSVCTQIYGFIISTSVHKYVVFAVRCQTLKLISIFFSVFPNYELIHVRIFHDFHPQIVLHSLSLCSIQTRQTFI